MITIIGKLMYKAIRYIGSKQKMLPFLKENLLYVLNKENAKFFDGFVGTGIVSQFVAENYQGTNVSGGDISEYSKILFNILNIGLVFPDSDRLETLLQEFIVGNQMIEGDIYHEFSQGGQPKSFLESRNFFHANTGKTIDSFRFYIQDNLALGKITLPEAQILLYFILAYSCKMANTTSVFGAFLKSSPKYAPFTLEFCKSIIGHLNIIKNNISTNANFYHSSIVESLQQLPPQTLIYLDPPYSTRRYESNYHILNYIVDVSFNHGILKTGSKTGQGNGVADNPFGRKNATEEIFQDMIDLGVEKSEVLGISYNSDGVISQQWMEEYCQQKGYQLTTKTQEYKRFKSKTEVTNVTKLEEILWILKK